MIYQITRYVNKKDLTEKQYTLTEGTLSRRLDEAGSLSVTIYDDVPADDDGMNDTWQVKEDGEVIFTGRPQESSLNYDGSVDMYIEGPFAWLQDYPIGLYGVMDVTDTNLTVSDDLATITGTPAAIASYIADVYNYQVGLHATGVNTSFRSVYVETDVSSPSSVSITIGYDISCMSALSSLLDATGAHMITTYKAPSTTPNPYVPYLEILGSDSSKWETGSQEVKLGYNITDGARKWEYGQATVYLPLGNTIEAIDSSDTTTSADDTHIKSTDTSGLKLVGQPLTLTNRTDVNSGSDYIKTGDEGTWGWVVETIQEDASTASELLTKANADIATKVISRVAHDISAADIHYAKGHSDVKKITFGSKVAVTYHDFKATLMVSEMETDLTGAIKSVSLGDIDKDKGISSQVSTTSKTATDASKTAKKASNKKSAGSSTPITTYSVNRLSGVSLSKNYETEILPSVYYRTLTDSTITEVDPDTVKKWYDAITAVALSRDEQIIIRVPSDTKPADLYSVSVQPFDVYIRSSEQLIPGISESTDIECQLAAVVTVYNQSVSSLIMYFVPLSKIHVEGNIVYFIKGGGYGNSVYIDSQARYR